MGLDYPVCGDHRHCHSGQFTLHCIVSLHQKNADNGLLPPHQSQYPGHSGSRTLCTIHSRHWGKIFGFFKTHSYCLKITQKLSLKYQFFSLRWSIWPGTMGIFTVSATATFTTASFSSCLWPSSSWRGIFLWKTASGTLPVRKAQFPAPGHTPFTSRSSGSSLPPLRCPLSFGVMYAHGQMTFTATRPSHGDPMTQR